MAGDYNSYTMEDPLDVLYQAGYTDVGQHVRPRQLLVLLLGLSGSLDHILVNDDGAEDVTGADHWNINSGESVALEYSRYNYHAHRLPRPRARTGPPTTTPWCSGLQGLRQVVPRPPRARPRRTAYGGSAPSGVGPPWLRWRP